MADNNKSVFEMSNKLTTIMLNGRSYLPWSRVVSIALGGRSKLGYVNGLIRAPASTDAKSAEWQANDNRVLSWLCNSMEYQIYEIFAYSEIAKSLWDSLQDMYGNIDNASRVFELQQDLAHTEQSPNQTFIEHLGNLKKKWDELRQPEYEDLKRQILMSSTLPNFATVCAIVQREETRCRVMTSNSKKGADLIESSAHAAKTNGGHYGSDGGRFGSGKGKGRNKKFHCDYCDRDGHSKDHCWELYPHLRPYKDKRAQTQGSTSDFQASLSKLALQLYHLIQFGGIKSSISDSSNLAQSSNSQALMALSSKSSFIVDSGATNHMCNTYYGISDFRVHSEGSHGPITVANGTQDPVEGQGTINLFSAACDVLFVPSLSSNLLSVSKLTNELDCNVVFSQQKAVVQDKLTGRTIGEGRLQQGLYVVDFPSEALVTRTDKEATSQLSHLRMGHP
ncbi:uncharacterized protein LOC130139257 [Syzygium oleosum]|uniref:uncharacterized protein LOC130139257 n=1 Tax=Syzygium oleosum TaxID=219896 RepID=UPI0024B8FCD0|nr:uncharacterized protein LOC130139257 [Syzygium oleosum]